MCFLAFVIFPKHEEKILTRLDMVAKTVFEGIEGQAYTIVPMILTVMYMALDRCKHEACYFKGCNLLLQIWLIEHLQKGNNRQELFHRPMMTIYPIIIRTELL